MFDPSGDWHSDDVDEYTGNLMQKVDDRFRWSFDVATATPWNDLVRFSMDNAVGWDPETRQWLDGRLECEAMLTVEQATNLRDRLTVALARIEADRVQSACNRDQG